MSEIRKQIEALLFSGGKAMSIDEISAVTSIEKKDVKKGLKELKEYYENLDSSLMITEDGTNYKLNIREQYVSLVTKIVSDTELSKTVLETLSVIAWKAPVLQSEVIKIRTNKAYDHIKELVDAGFVNKDPEGRSYVLKVSEKFFNYFDVPGYKGIREAFRDIKMPVKKDPEKLGELDVVPVENNSQEHGKTAQIFGSHDGKESADAEPDKKEEIPPVDEAFLQKINRQIDEIAKRNDDLDGDELFHRPNSEEQFSSEDVSNDASEDDSLTENNVKHFDQEDTDTVEDTSDEDSENDASREMS